MNQYRHQAVLCSMAILACACHLPADTVKLEAKPAFHNVRITNFRDGRLVFRGVSLQHLRKPHRQVEWIEIDRLPTLGRAERAHAAEQWTVAASAYRQVLSEAGQPWLADWIRLRLLEVLDRSGAFDEAVSVYIELVTDRSALIADAAPRHPAPPGSPLNRAALRQLQSALAASRSSRVAACLRNLLLELVLYEDADDLSAVITDPTKLESLPATSAPATDPPRLPADSFVLAAAREALKADNPQRAARLLERAMPFVDPAETGPWRLVLGRCRLELGEFAQAAAELVRVADTDPDPATAAEALYYLGLAHERLDRPELAADLYRELLQRENVPAQVRAQARAALSRVGD